MRVAHLYPRLLGDHGDAGNMVCLARRGARRNVDVRIETVEREDQLPSDADVIFLGHGGMVPRRLAAADLARRREQLIDAVASGAFVFGVGAGFHLIGRSIIDEEGEFAALGVIDMATRPAKRRVVGHTSVLVRIGRRRELLTGFNNRTDSACLGPGVSPLGLIVAGIGNDDGDRGEGAAAGNVVGTNLHGPVLALNPWLTDVILDAGLARRGESRPAAPVHEYVGARDESIRLAVANHKRSRRRRLLARLLSVP